MSSAICGDGMCPYIPCKNCPNCKHFKEMIRDKEMMEK